MTISLNGFDNKVATFATINTIDKGCVCMRESNSVKNTIDGEDFIGICISAKYGSASVLMNGYVEMKYTGTDPSLGFKNIIASGKSTVKVVDSPVAGKKRLVTKVDKANKTIGFIL